jgi:hypothetical protein
MSECDRRRKIFKQDRSQLHKPWIRYRSTNIEQQSYCTFSHSSIQHEQNRLLCWSLVDVRVMDATDDLRPGKFGKEIVQLPTVTEVGLNASVQPR